MRLVGITSLSDRRLEVYPYRSLLDLFSDAIKIFNADQVWNWTRTATLLPYIAGQRLYDLKEYDICPNKVQRVIITITNGVTSQYRTLDRVDYRKFKASYSASPVLSQPWIYTIKQNKINFYPTPDKDYTITVWHFADIKEPRLSTSILSTIPVFIQRGYCCFVKCMLAYMMGKSNAELVKQEYLMAMAEAEQDNQQTLDNANVVPSNFSWF